MEDNTKMGKLKKTFRFHPTSVQILAELAERDGITETAVLEKLLRKESVAESSSTELAEKVLAAFEDKYGNSMTGVLLSSRQSERYGYILIEMLNSLIQNSIVGSQEMFFGTHRYEILQAKQNKDFDRADQLAQYTSASYKGAVEDAQNFFTYVKQRKDNATPGAG